MLLSLTSPAAAVAAAYHGVLAAMPLDLLPDGRNRIVVGTAADSPRLPTSASCQCYFPAAECRRLLCRVALPHQTTLPVGSTRLAVTGLIAKCADMFPLVSDYPHICFLLDMLQLLLLLPLLLSRSAHGITPCDLQSPLRYVRRGCPRLYSHRGASAAAVFPSFRGDTTLPACTTPSPSEHSDDGGTAALPAAPSVGGD